MIFKKNHIKWIGKIILLFTFSASYVQASYAQDNTGKSADATKGEEQFNNYCSACHSVKKRVIGPALMGISERKDLEWITQFVQNSQKVIASGDEYAVALYEEYGKAQMTSFPSLTKNDVSNILAYVKQEEQKKEDAKSTDTSENQTTTANKNTGEENPLETIILIGIYLILLVLLIILYSINKVSELYIKSRESELNDEDKEFIANKFKLTKFLKSASLLGFASFIVITLGVKYGIDTLFTIGVQQNYQPTQPINFSHKIHAGDYQIDCNYCHTGAYKSKNANIPSANICMNCHTYVQKEGSSELAKLYEYVDFKPNKFDGGTFGKKGKPIAWVRIHNLTDLSYFNHAQHTTVGKQKCQTCHGPIETMEKVYQYSNLTMGWCIDCHRTTNVNAKGNEYYDKILKLHKEKGLQSLTVEDIGGTECSKCHY